MRAILAVLVVTVAPAGVVAQMSKTASWVEASGSKDKVCEVALEPLFTLATPGAGRYVRVDDFVNKQHYYDSKASVASWFVMRMDSAGDQTHEYHHERRGTLAVEVIHSKLNLADYPFSYCGTAAQMNPPAFAEAVRLYGAVSDATASTEVVMFQGAQYAYRFRLTFDELGRPTRITDVAPKSDGTLVDGTFEFTWSYDGPTDMLPTKISTLAKMDHHVTWQPVGQREWKPTYTFHANWPQTR